MSEDVIKTQTTNSQDNLSKDKLDEIEYLKKYSSYCKKTAITVMICFFIYVLFFIGMFVFIGTSNLWAHTTTINPGDIFENDVTLTTQDVIIVTIPWVFFGLFLITLIVSLVVQIIWCVRTLTLNNDQLKNDATIWGIIGLFLLPIIPEFIMKSKVDSYIKKLK